MKRIQAGRPQTIEEFLVGWGSHVGGIVGIFHDRAAAEAECTTAQHWVQPLVPNQGAEFPKVERYFPKKK
jgi:hypothetical protein